MGGVWSHYRVGIFALWGLHCIWLLFETMDMGQGTLARASGVADVAFLMYDLDHS